MILIRPPQGVNLDLLDTFLLMLWGDNWPLEWEINADQNTVSVQFTSGRESMLVTMLKNRLNKAIPGYEMEQMSENL